MSLWRVLKLIQWHKSSLERVDRIRIIQATLLNGGLKARSYRVAMYGGLYFCCGCAKLKSRSANVARREATKSSQAP